jgi:hypothetical protein
MFYFNKKTTDIAIAHVVVQLFLMPLFCIMSTLKYQQNFTAEQAGTEHARSRLRQTRQTTQPQVHSRVQELNTTKHPPPPPKKKKKKTPTVSAQDPNPAKPK